MIEGGHRRPSDEKLSVIAGRLGLDVGELVSGVPAGLEPELEVELQLARQKADEGDLDGAAVAIEQVREAAEQHGLSRVLARAEEALGAIEERRADFNEALARYQRAEAIWSTEAIHLRAAAIANAAKCMRMLGNPQMAVHSLDYYRRELLATGQPHPDALMNTYSEMVYAYFAVGLPEKASEAARNALSLESQVDDGKHLACMHLTVARSLLYEERYADALDSIRRAHELYSAGGWRSKAAKARIAEAFVLSNEGRYEEARKLLLEALEVLRKSPNRVDEAMALDQLGHVMRHLGEPVVALEFLDEAQAYLPESGVLEQAFNARERGLCLREMDAGEAESELRRAIDLYVVGGARDELAGTYRDLGDLYVDQGRSDDALHTFRKGLQSVEKPSR